MKPHWTRIGIGLVEVMIVVGGAAGVGYPADEDRQTAGQHATSASSVVPSQPQAPAASAATGAEAMMLQVGTIAGLDLVSSVQTLTLNLSDGKTSTLILDPQSSTFLKGEERLPLERVRVTEAGGWSWVGQRVKVSYALNEGKKMVKTVRLIRPAPTSTPASPTTTSH